MQLGAALAELRAVAESYPELRASENFQQLSASLAQIESDIAAARGVYNADAQAYNTKIQIFPNSIVATHGSFGPREYFEIDEADERRPASVRFDGA